MSKLKLTIVTPVFNEEEVIACFYEKTRAILNSIEDIEGSILFVVDRSTDNTLKILRSIIAKDPQAKAIYMSSRFGHQMSLLAGIEHSKNADVIIMMDSDLQHPPEMVPQLLAEYHKGAAVVYTVRRNTKKIGFIRNVLGNVFYRFLKMISCIPIKANTADFRLINRKVADSLISGFKERNVFLRGLFLWIGFNQASIEYDPGPRLVGKSKYSLSRMLQLATVGILSFSTRPLHTGIFVGVGFAALAFFFILWALISYFIDRAIPSGWTTLVILLLLFSGVQLIVLGIMGAYIGGIYEEIKGRPRYIIDEEITHDDNST